MLFPYVCSKCGKRFDGDFPIGKAPRGVPCPSCGSSGKRVYEGMSIAVKVSGRTSFSTFGEQMKAKNAAAGHRMKGRKPPVRLRGFEMPDGKVVEV
jgi:DNA-directed RNA polymerase subunit RPC12/RpoP